MQKQERREWRHPKKEINSEHQQTQDITNEGCDIRKYSISELKSRPGGGDETTLKVEEPGGKLEKKRQPPVEFSTKKRNMPHLRWESNRDNQEGNRDSITSTTTHKKQRKTTGTTVMSPTRISSMQDPKKKLCASYEEQTEEIHIWRSCHHHGLFSNFTLALTFIKEHFRDDGRVAVAIDWSNLKTYPTPNNTNLWNMLFMQPFTTSGQSVRLARNLLISSEFPGDFTHSSGVSDRGGDINPKVLLQGRNLVLQHIRVRPHIQEKALKFIRGKLRRGMFPKILAVHIRRTDKHTESRLNFMLQYLDIYYMIQNHLRKNGYDAFFLCTDDRKLKSFMVAKAGKTCIIYNSRLSQLDHVPPHFDENIDGYSKAEDVLVEVLCMASCSGFVSTLSNVANAVLFFANDQNLIKNHVYLHNLAARSLYG